MFAFLEKLMSKEKIEGVSAADMSLADLKQLCKENNLDIKGLTTKKDILTVVHAWEEELLKKTDEEIAKRGATSVKKDTGVANVKSVSFHEGKMVLSKTDIIINGVDYTDITVEGGITYRVRSN